MRFARARRFAATTYDKAFRTMLVRDGADPIVLAVYDEMVYLAAREPPIPYHLGGGHPDMLIADGLDCSSALCRAVQRKAHILTREGLPAEALDTTGLIRLGLPGEGKHLTLFVIDELPNGQRHCVARLTAMGFTRWWGGRHTGTFIGWLKRGFDTTGYTARRRKG